MTTITPLERREVEKVRVHRLIWNRAPSAHAHHTTDVVAASENEAIEILRDHLGFEIDCWFEDVD